MRRLFWRAALVGCLASAMAQAQTSRVNPSIPFTSGEATHVAPAYEPAAPPDNIAMLPAERGRYTLNKYAECLVQFDRKAVNSALKAPVGQASTAAETRLSVDSCLADGSLKFDPSILRGALFRALYRTDRGRLAATTLTGTADYRADVENGIDSTQYVALHQFGDCIVRDDPDDSRGVTVSATGSAAERQYLSGLSPHLSTCLPKGAQIRFSKPVLFGVIAESLYRLTAAKVSQSS